MGPYKGEVPVYGPLGLGQGLFLRLGQYGTSAILATAGLLVSKHVTLQVTINGFKQVSPNLKAVLDS